MLMSVPFWTRQETLARPSASHSPLGELCPVSTQLEISPESCGRVRGVVHAVLSWQAFRLYRGLSPSSGTSERGVATEAFQWPLGDWLVVLAGLGLIGFAVQQVYAAITCRLERNLDVEEMRREAGESAVGLSRFGVAARAVVFALLGWAIVVAGWFRDPSEVGTTASSFRTARCTTGRAGPLASRRDGSRVCRVRLLPRSSTRAIYISDASGETSPVRPWELLGQTCTPAMLLLL